MWFTYSMQDCSMSSNSSPISHVDIGAYITVNRFTPFNASAASHDDVAVKTSHVNIHAFATKRMAFFHHYWDKRKIRNMVKTAKEREYLSDISKYVLSLLQAIIDSDVEVPQLQVWELLFVLNNSGFIRDSDPWEKHGTQSNIPDNTDTPVDESTDDDEVEPRVSRAVDDDAKSSTRHHKAGVATDDDDEHVVHSDDAATDDNDEHVAHGDDAETDDDDEHVAHSDDAAIDDDDEHVAHSDDAASDDDDGGDDATHAIRRTHAKTYTKHAHEKVSHVTSPPSTHAAHKTHHTKSAHGRSEPTPHASTGHTEDFDLELDELRELLGLDIGTDVVHTTQARLPAVECTAEVSSWISVIS